MSEENPGKEEIKESINKLAKKMEQKIIEDARLKIESGFAEEPTTEEYWKAERLKVFDVQANNFNTEIKDVDLGDLTGEEWISPVFPPVAFKGVVLPPLQARDAWVDEMSKALSQFPQADAEDWKDSWDGKISLEKHLARTKHMSDMIDTQYQENKHLIITNRVLTILLIFSTAFGITAALAWLRCQ